MNQGMMNGPISVQIESSQFYSPLYRFRMEDESIKPRITPPPRRVSSSFSPEVSASEHPRDHEQLEKGVQQGGEGVQYGGQVILSHILFQVEVQLIAIRYKSPGNFNPESVRIDLDDGDFDCHALT